MSFTTVTVTGKYLTAAGTPESGTVSFTLSAPMMDAAGKVIRSTATVTATLDGTGAFSLALPANDDTTTTPTGTTYGVVEQLSHNYVRAYAVVVPHTAAAGTVDITALAPVANSSISYGVTSVNGLTGAVTLNAASSGSAIYATDPAYGVVPDGRRVTDGAITSGTAILTSATAAFVPQDVGKRVTVAGAGAAGIVLNTTILSRQSATQVTLAANASVSQSAAELYVGTDNTTALQAARNAADATGVALMLPVGVTMINAALTTSRRGVKMIGTNRSITEIHQCNPTADGITVGNSSDADPVVASTVPSEMAFEGFRITGPASGVVSSSTGAAIRIDPNAGWNGSMCKFDVQLSGFTYGLYGDGMQDTSGEVLATACDTGVYLRGQHAYQNNNHLTISTSRCGTVGLIIDVGLGSVIKLKDMINQPCGVRILNGAYCTLLGGEFEQVTGAGTTFIDVQAGANVNHYGPVGFTKDPGGNTSVSGWTVAAGATLNVYGRVAWDSSMGNNYMTAPSGAITRHHGDIINNTLRVSTGSTTYPPNPLPVLDDASAAFTPTNYRGQLIYVASRDTSTKEDRLLFPMREKDNATYRTWDLLQERVLFSTAGNKDYQRAEGMRRYGGRIPFTTAAADHTDVVVTLGEGAATVAFSTVYHALATVSIEGGSGVTGPVSAVYLTSSTTTVTFRVYHAGDVAGGKNWRLMHSIAVTP